MTALFLFAHQDDEFAAAPWIAEELRAGSRVACLYLTSGGSRTQPAVRDAETMAALQWLGVDAAGVAMLGDASGRIADGDLASHVPEGIALVDAWLAAHRFSPQRIYAPSYEGGHPDHDAAHLVAADVAVRHGVLHDAWHFSLYHAYRTRKPFFATMRQLPSPRPSRRARTSLRDRWALTMLCWRYRSQRRTWLGLFPGALLERVILARERVVQFDAGRLSQRPHDGELLYERLFGLRYDEFAARTRR